jgi:AAA15 family ATPase/GTPase
MELLYTPPHFRSTKCVVGAFQMLLRFRVKNHLSLKQGQDLSLVASSLHDREDGLITDIPGSRERALPVGIIYGANASGKSNIHDAFRFVRHMVRNSHREGEPESKIERQPFLLDAESGTSPSEFVVDFVVEGTRYQYGFSVTTEAVLEEWLKAYPKDQPQQLLSRRRQRFMFSRLLKGRNQVISDLTRPNSLFVSAAAQNDHEALSVISRYFRSWRANSPNSTSSPAEWKEEVDRRIIDFLSEIGTGVVDCRVQDEPQLPTINAFMKEFSEIAKRHIKGFEPPPLQEAVSKLQLAHRAKGGEKVFFDLGRESEGTRRLLHLLRAAFLAMSEGSVLFVDELDASLHTLACEQVVALFSNKGLNTKGAQLLATTHDTNLLKSPFLRRDQIWFVAKNDDGESSLYPLSDLRTRKGDDLERGYLQGRFGALPDWPSIVASKYA